MPGGTDDRPRAESVDAHAHLDKYCDDELDSVVGQIEADRILTISVSVDPRSFARARTIADRCRLVVPTFGVHPWEAPRLVGILDELEAICATSPMIGEIGLDHRFVTDPRSRAAQRVVLDSLLDVAVEQRKMVHVHSSGAEAETAAMLRSRRIDRVIMHWYSGDFETLGALIDRGVLFTVGAAVLHSAHVRRIAARIPDDQVLIETDNPGGQDWLTGQRGQPRLLHRIESELAGLRGTTPRRLRSLVRANLRRQFWHDPHLEPWSELLETR